MLWSKLLADQWIKCNLYTRHQNLKKKKNTCTVERWTKGFKRISPKITFFLNWKIFPFEKENPVCQIPDVSRNMSVGVHIPWKLELLTNIIKKRLWLPFDFWIELIWCLPNYPNRLVPWTQVPFFSPIMGTISGWSNLSWITFPPSPRPRALGVQKSDRNLPLLRCALDLAFDLPLNLTGSTKSVTSL